MLQPEMSPRKQPSTARHCVENGDDINLPPMPGAQAEKPISSSKRPSNQVVKPPPSSGIWNNLGISVALMAAVAAGVILFPRSSAVEKQHPNWKHVEAAQRATASGQPMLEFVDAAGNSGLTANLVISGADLDPSSPQAVRDANAGTPADFSQTVSDIAQQANAIQSALLKELQTDRRATPTKETLTLSSDGSTRFFQIRLFDSCAEDGDEVEVSVNGKRVAHVTLSHEGKVISVPLRTGSDIAIKGIRDGGYGITVMLETSQGQFFDRALSVGEEHHIGIVVK